MRSVWDCTWGDSGEVRQVFGSFGVEVFFLGLEYNPRGEGVFDVKPEAAGNRRELSHAADYIDIYNISVET